MAKVNLNIQQFLLEKGERVGLAVAGLLAILLIVLYLFYPGHGLLAPSAAEKAKTIVDLAGQKDRELKSNKPSDEEARVASTVDPRLLQQASNPPEEPSAWRFQYPIIAGDTMLASSRRRNPIILSPTEYRLAVMPAKIKTYMMQKDRDTIRIGILQGSNLGRKFAPPKALRDLIEKHKKAFRGTATAMGSAVGGAPAGPGPGFAPGPAPAVPGGDFPGVEKEMQVQYVTLEELGKISNPELAETMLPLHMAVIAASFPYGAQVEEFKKALRLAQPAMVFGEVVAEGDKDTRGRPGFQFLGLEVQRRIVGPDGKTSDWMPLDLDGPGSPFRDLVVKVGKRYEPDQRDVRPLMVDGLVMPRPIQVSENAYPAIEKELPEVKKTIEEVTAKSTMRVVQPKNPKFDPDDIKTFGGGEDALVSTQGPGGMPAGTPAPMPAAMPLPGGADGAKPGDPAALPSEWAPPSCCLLRFLDVTLEPGKTYEYRLRVKMLNPNYKRKASELAYPALAEKRELISEWMEVKGENDTPLRARVAPDLYYYAVDQKAIDPANYKGPSEKLRPEQAPIQVHRWIDYHYLNERNRLPVGDWSIAERLLVNRGESLGQKTLSKLPFWASEKRGFQLLTRPGSSPRDKRAQMVEVNFGTDSKVVPLLVDFAGGPNLPLVHRHVAPGTEGPRPTGSKVEETAPMELVLLSPSGILLARSSVVDESDPERKERYEAWVKRVENVGTQPSTISPSGKTHPFTN